MSVSRPKARAWLTRRDVLIAAISAVWFSMRLGRSYIYDESVTIGSFVEVDTLRTAMTRQNNFNNHPGMTAIANLMHQAGFGSPLSYRLVPLVFAVIAVVALHRAASSWYSPSAGLVAAAALMVHPMFGDFATQVRGYAPMVCFVTLASIEFIDFSRGDADSPRARFYVFAGLATLFHLYAVLPLACIGLIVVGLRRPGWTDLVARSVLAILVGLVGYLGVMRTMVASAGQRANMFQPDLPADVGWMLAGGSVAAVVLVGGALLLGLSRWLVDSIESRFAVVGVLLSFAAVWLVLMPRDAYPRMWLWLVPAGALAVATAWDRVTWFRPALAVGLCVVAATSVAEAASGDRSSEVVGGVLETSIERGNVTCGIGYSVEPFAAYAAPRQIMKSAELSECDVVVAHPFFEDYFMDLELPNAIVMVDGSLDRYLLGWTSEVERTTPGLSLFTASKSARPNDS